MIKPSEALPLNHESPSPRYTADQLAKCESDFDVAIEDARLAGKWPAQVRSSRDGMPVAAILDTAKRYRAVGWIVETTLTPRGVRATIDHDRSK